MLSSNALLEEVNIVFIDCLATSMLKVPPNILLENIEFFITMNISGSYVIRIVIVLCLPLPSVRHLSFISKLKARSVSKVKVVSANVETILYEY